MRNFCLALVLLAVPASAASITNGGFESGLTGWTISGNVSPTVSPTTGQVNALGAGDFNPFVPQEGSKYAELSNGPGGINSVPTADYSEISSGLYSITPGVGAIFSFYYILGTAEPIELPFQDFGLVRIVSESGVELYSHTFSTGDLPAPTGGGCAGFTAPDTSTICTFSGYDDQAQTPAAVWQFFSIPLAPWEGGENVRFIFRVQDSFEAFADNGVDTVLLLDNVQASGLDSPNAVPEPSTSLFGGAALVALYVRRRARKA